MKIYVSELDIPELENLPVKAARKIWRELYFKNADWYNLTLLIGPVCAGLGAAVVGLIGTDSTTATFVGVFSGAYLGHEIHRQIMIWHLRPKIRKELEMRKPSE